MEQIRRRAERELEIVYSTIFVENFMTPSDCRSPICDETSVY